MRRTSEERNRAMVERVNAFLAPLALDYEADVCLRLRKEMPPNDTRVLCMPARRPRISPRNRPATAFWGDKLGVPPGPQGLLPDGRGMTRPDPGKDNEAGEGAGLQPDSGSFPNMAEMNEFVLKCGALPTFTWLDGTSEGEQSIEELIEVGRSTGVVVFNIIPDRNYTPEPVTKS